MLGVKTDFVWNLFRSWLSVRENTGAFLLKVSYSVGLSHNIRALFPLTGTLSSSDAYPRCRLTQGLWEERGWRGQGSVSSWSVCLLSTFENVQFLGGF